MRAPEEPQNKITAFHLVDEIVEKDAAMLVIAQVLNNGAAKGVPVCLAQFVRCGMWKALEEDGLDVGIPSRVDDGFMRDYGVGRAAGRPRKNQDENAKRCNYTFT